MLAQSPPLYEPETRPCAEQLHLPAGVAEATTTGFVAGAPELAVCWVGAAHPISAPTTARDARESKAFMGNSFKCEWELTTQVLRK